MDDNCKRSEEDVLATLKLSKLNVENLSKPSQTLYFTSEASDQEFTLIQLNKDIIEHITIGEDVVIRGNEDDSATLCTSDRTYDIKKARTSNTLLFLPKCTVVTKKKSTTSLSDDNDEENNCAENFSLLHQEITGWSHDYLELKRIQPQTKRIKKLLDDNPYQGPEKEVSGKKKYTMSELLDVIQASEGELMSALYKLGVCCIEGFWRILDFGYIVDCVGEICNVIDSESWDIFNIPIKELCEKINDSGELVPEFIVHHLMTFYGSVNHNDDANGVYYKLDEAKLCRFFAEMLLRDVGKFNLSEFLEVWDQSVPDGLKPDKIYLRGLAIIDSDTKPATIQHFPVEKLPQDTAARFDILFQTRTKWSREEIEPYIEDLCLEGQTVSALLTKYARSSLQNGSKVFCSRKTLK